MAAEEGTNTDGGVPSCFRKPAVGLPNHIAAFSVLHHPSLHHWLRGQHAAKLPMRRPFHTQSCTVVLQMDGRTKYSPTTALGVPRTHACATGAGTAARSIALPSARTMQRDEKRRGGHRHSTKPNPSFPRLDVRPICLTAPLVLFILDRLCVCIESTVDDGKERGARTGIPCSTTRRIATRRLSRRQATRRHPVTKSGVYFDRRTWTLLGKLQLPSYRPSNSPPRALQAPHPCPLYETSLLPFRSAH